MSLPVYQPTSTSTRSRLPVWNVGLVLLPTAIPAEVTQVAEDLHRTIPNRFGTAAVKRRAAKVQEEFTVRRALRQAQVLPWHGTSPLAAYDDAGCGRSGRRQHLR